MFTFNDICLILYSKCCTFNQIRTTTRLLNKLDFDLGYMDSKSILLKYSILQKTWIYIKIINEMNV